MINNCPSDQVGSFTYKGTVKTQAFYDLLKQWKPDIGYMGSFGQILNEEILKITPGGIFNAHPADGVAWPSCAGPDPFEQMLRSRPRPSFCAIALHRVNTAQDDGPLTVFSKRVVIPYGVLDKIKDDALHISEEKFPSTPDALGRQVLLMHQITSPVAARLINAHLRTYIGLDLIPRQESHVERVERAKELEKQRIKGYSKFEL